MKKLMQTAILTIGLTMTSCQGFIDAVLGTEDNPVPTNPVEKEVTLEDALNDGTIVAFSFNLNGEDFYVAFLRVGDTYELLDYDKMLTRGDEPTITEKDCEFTMEHDKANNVIKFIVKEKKTSDLVLTAFIDVKESTIEVIPGDPKYKVTGVKMKVANVEITSQLRDKTGNATLAEALVKGSVVEITYKQSGNPPTVFTFVNNGGTFSCKISGFDASNFEGSSLTINGSTLAFSAENWGNSGCDLQINFNTATNSYRFWTVNHSFYESHTIMVNNTDLTSALTEER